MFLGIFSHSQSACHPVCLAPERRWGGWKGLLKVGRQWLDVTWGNWVSTGRGSWSHDRYPPTLPRLFIKPWVQRLAKNKDRGHFYQQWWQGTNKDSLYAFRTQTHRKLKNTHACKQLKVKKSSQDNETIYIVLTCTHKHTHKGDKSQYQGWTISVAGLFRKCGPGASILLRIVWPVTANGALTRIHLFPSPSLCPHPFQSIPCSIVISLSAK